MNEQIRNDVQYMMNEIEEDRFEVMQRLKTETGDYNRFLLKQHDRSLRKHRAALRLLLSKLNGVMV